MSRLLRNLIFSHCASNRVNKQTRYKWKWFPYFAKQKKNKIHNLFVEWLRFLRIYAPKKSIMNYCDFFHFAVISVVSLCCCFQCCCYVNGDSSCDFKRNNEIINRSVFPRKQRVITIVYRIYRRCPSTSISRRDGTNALLDAG